ncbi:hypothetical protein [Pseudomonas kurunegalensis]|uniref:hypothetical protein n=1 Tax=Pseudomonas kurunegalensis TaxID=485880 RepID=UPI0023636EB3|nr:hypothetical protein [Pseudomonas kurunegalensis]MDD2133328.1 hypothetical protein [Pseudomonas kurunegalensis]
MPTENRSSNTELQQIEAASAAMTQIRAMLGREQQPVQVAAALEACDWSDTPIGNKAIILSAIQALRSPQPHPEPIAWMVGTAFWWTKEEAERDAAATGLPVVGLGPMVDPVVTDRLSTAIAFVQRMVECAGTQQSVATGYVRDILDVLKGNATPRAPVEIDELRTDLSNLEVCGDRPSADIPDSHDEFLDANASAALWLLLNVDRIRAALTNNF